jgi:hypothetical protein
MYGPPRDCKGKVWSRRQVCANVFGLVDCPMICTSEEETHWNEESKCHEANGISLNR